MAEQIKTKQVTAVVKSVPKKKDWPGIEAAKKTAGNLGKNQELFDKVADLMANVLSEAYNVKPNDPKMMSEINTIVKAVSQAVVSNLSDKSSDSLTENQVKEIVSEIVSNSVKESNLNKEQYQKLVDDITSEVQLYASEVNKHKTLLEDIKSQLNTASESLSKIVDNKTATEQKSSKQDNTDKSKTDFNQQFASLSKMIQKINGICQSVTSKQKDLSKSLSKSVKMLDATQSISNKIKDQVKQSAKMQSDVKNITTSGFNQTAKQIKDVNKAVEEVNKNVKSISSSGSILGILSGGFGIAFKTLSWLGKVFIFGPIKFIGKYILGPIVSFVGSAIKGLGKIILAPVKLITKGIGKVLDGITNVAAKSFGAFIMSPAGMYTIGYIAGFVWTMWLKDWWEKIKAFFESDTWETIKSAATTAFDWIIKFSKTYWPELKESIDNIGTMYNAIVAYINPEKYAEDTVNKYKKSREQDLQKAKDKNAELTEEQLKEKQRSNLLDDETLRNLMRQAQMINDLRIKNDVNKNLKEGSWFDRFTLKAHDWLTDTITDGLNSRDLKIEYGQRLEDLKIQLANLGITDPEQFINEHLSTLITPDSIKQGDFTVSDKISDEDLSFVKHLLERNLGLEKEVSLTPLSELSENDNPSFAYAAYLADTEERKIEEKLIQYEQEDVLRELKRRQQEIEDAVSKQTPTLITENNIIETNEQQKNDSYFIGSGWQSIDKKWIYGDDGENNSEYARAVKTGTPIVQANTTLSKDQFHQLFTRQQGIKVEDVTFNDLWSALTESGLSIGGAADVGSSKQLAKNIATYLADTQKQIDAMPAEEQRAWQRDLNIKILSLIKAINERQPQQNLMYLQVGQPSLNPANYDK